MDELIAKSWRFVRERFRSYQAERKSHGQKRATARRMLRANGRTSRRVFVSS
jgi:incFII family plasmid replication initiator RepA